MEKGQHRFHRSPIPLAGIIFTISAGCTTTVFVFVSEMSGSEILILTSSLSALLVSTIAWKILLSKYSPINNLKGAITGGVIGFISIPLSWVFFSIISVLGKGSYSIAHTVYDFRETLFVMIMFIGIFGWIIFPIGGATGILVVYLQRKLWLLDDHSLLSEPIAEK
ncbi:MAG: hypothetical protein OEY93_12620 [Anaerolineae bacterium]|nr:hypothetical protein [Anaerolineae bacterium]